MVEVILSDKYFITYRQLLSLTPCNEDIHYDLIFFLRCYEGKEKKSNLKADKYTIEQLSTIGNKTTVLLLINII